jgi:hypothetical protein
VQSHFRVQVSKDYLVFASAHFITFRGHQCETLHGHNYRVGVAVEGSVDAELRDQRNTRNPGTTADLTCASIFAVILEDGWNR